MATEFPVEYLNTLDHILATESFTAPYQVQGAEFVNAKTVNIPQLNLANSLANYSGSFSNNKTAELKYEAYTLDKDREYSFTVDAVEDIDEGHLRVANGAAEVQRRLLIPEVDTDFFAKALANAGTKKTATLGLTTTTGTGATTGIKEALRDVRSVFVQYGIGVDADLFISSTALALLEEATDRQWAGEGDIHTMIGRYDIFNVYEVPDAILGVDFCAIAGGQNTIKEVVKRAVTRVFAPEVNQASDGWLVQMRWVYGALAPKNQKWGIYTNKASS